MRKSNCKYCKKGIVLNPECDKVISKYYCDIGAYDKETGCTNCPYRKKARQIMAKPKKLKKLSAWDWTTLVAAWRYYEYRSTIASATFPQDIYERFFTGDYDEESCRQIAHQFYSVDHGRNGEADWQGQSDIDAKPWAAFYAFCKAYCEGFAKVHTKDPSIHEAYCGAIHEAFYCETIKAWIPRGKYRGDTHVRIADDWIVKIEEAGNDKNN